MLHLHANLVCPACFQLDRHQAQPVPVGHGAAMEDGFLALQFEVRRQHGDHVLFRVLGQIVHVGETVGSFALHDGHVLTVQLMHLYLLGKPRRRFAGAGKHQQAAHRPVHPVHQADVGFAGLVVGFLHVFLDLIQQVFILGFIPLGQQILGLHRHDYVIILVQNSRCIHVIPLSSMAFSEGGLGETAHWPPKSGFPQHFLRSYLAIHRPVAPQGSTPPERTGRQSSWESISPPYFRATVFCRIFCSTAGWNPVV